MVFGLYSFLTLSKKQWSLDSILFCLRLKNNGLWTLFFFDFV
jgi:hypothetical protein